MSSTGPMEGSKDQITGAPELVQDLKTETGPSGDPHGSRLRRHRKKTGFGHRLKKRARLIVNLLVYAAIVSAALWLLLEVIAR